MSGLALIALCAEIARLGAVVSAPQNWVPRCGDDGADGYVVFVDGEDYVFNYRERGVAAEIFRSQKEQPFLERVFVEVTHNTAVERRTDGLPLTDPFEPPPSFDEARESAVALQTETAEIQEELLGRLDPNWRVRQARLNAEQLARTKAFFGQ